MLREVDFRAYGERRKIMKEQTVECLMQALFRAPVKLRRTAIVAAERALANHTTALLVSQAEAARLLSCSRFTIWRMTREGQLHPVKIRGVDRYKVAELEQIASGETAA